ncbi:hypothetical protein [Kitasatospora sp. NBC_01266]|uniref:hypothetical protein n=1 Tax=Kitasatospora sp. NBC_01266 TaxID=2903572 RepID=UPI002E337A0B|nr:hypothetical protein [Kitasatospora sp. NBC_01266]
MAERLERDSQNVHPFRDVVQSIAQAPTWAVLWLVGVSMGLGLVGAQVETLWVLVLFSIVWGVTVLAVLGWLARWIAHHEGGGGQRPVVR